VGANRPQHRARTIARHELVAYNRSVSDAEAKPEDDVDAAYGPFVWVIGPVTLASVVVMLLDWFDVGIFDEKAPFAIMAILAVGLLGLTVEGFRTGRLALRGGRIRRQDHPVVFWIFSIIYVLISAGLFVGLVAGLLGA